MKTIMYCYNKNNNNNNNLFQGCPDNLTKQIIYQTLNGVAYCHSQGTLEM